MKKISLFIILIVLPFMRMVNAQQQISVNEARNAAIHTLHNKAYIVKRSSDTEIDTIYSFSNSRNNVLMYEVVFKNRVAILLSGSKASLPILGYYIKDMEDNKSVFDENNIYVPDGLKTLLKTYADEIEWCFRQTDIALSYQNQWEKLQQSEYSTNASRKANTVQLNFLTRWAQQWSYYGDCPAYNFYVTSTNSNQCGSENCENRCPLGCAAVAMGQVMKYWNYPVYLPNKTYQYDWCNMPDTLLSSDSLNYEKERNAIARLLKDCADAANTVYCIAQCNSSATLIDARHTLVNDFGYSNDANHRLRSSHPNDANWKNFIKTDLDNGRPVIYGSIGIFDGHWWVIDGYNTDDEFHFNWGWGGPDGWYTIDNITKNPHWNSLQEAIFEIHPNLDHDYCDYSFPLTLHFDLGGIQENVPKTFTLLESVPSGNGFPTSYHTIVSGQAVEYVAHKRIVLQTGFKVEAGAHFIARIEPCESCETLQSMLFLTQNEDSTLNLYNANDTSLQKSLENLQEEERASKKYIYLFPNPNNGTFTIKTNFDEEEILSIHVYNILGQRIYKQTGISDNTIQLPHSAKGIFWVEIMTQSQSFIKKIAVQ